MHAWTQFFSLLTNPYSRRARSLQTQSRPSALFLCPEHDSHKGAMLMCVPANSIVAKCFLSRTVFDALLFCLGHTYDSHQREKVIIVVADNG